MHIYIHVFIYSYEYYMSIFQKSIGETFHMPVYITHIQYSIYQSTLLIDIPYAHIYITHMQYSVYLYILLIDIPYAQIYYSYTIFHISLYITHRHSLCPNIFLIYIPYTLHMPIYVTQRHYSICQSI